MSYTLRGRIESRLTALVPVAVAAAALAAALHRYWPVEALGLMLGLGLALDLQAYHRLLPYQPGWAALPLGALELGVLLGLMRALGIMAPLGQAVALFAAGWAVAQVLGHAGFPLIRLSYGEEGGELGLLGAASGALLVAGFAAAGATAYVLRPPVVHLAAGVHQGPLVITRREVLVGSRGAVVRGGIVVRANGVTIKNVTVVGGENGITVDGVHGTVLDGVSVSGAKLDGIHVRLADIMIKNCSVDMLGNALGQGIDISYNMDMGMSMVEGCSIVGGMQGITTHSSMSDIVDNDVSNTQGEAIAVTEMSMGTARDNQVRNANGVGLYCNDRSMCLFEHNTVVGTKNDSAGGDRSRRGFGVLASFLAEAELDDNALAANPVPVGTVTNAEVVHTR